MQPRITFLSPLADIANDIADQYLLRPFPDTYLPNGLLDYTAIRKLPIDQSVVERPIHGYQNACRAAALVLRLFTLYKRYINQFPSKLQDEIHAITPDYLKKLQVVSLLRATGRTQDSDHGGKFSAQGEKECVAYLDKLDIWDVDERKQLASLIVGKEKSFAMSLLFDAFRLETLRDTVPYDQKKIRLSHFDFYQHLKDKESVALAKFIQLACHHANVIKKHQGFLLAAIQKKDGSPVTNNWPALDIYEDWLNKASSLLKKQLKLEHSKTCFEQCMKDVGEFQIKPPKKVTSSHMLAQHSFENYALTLRKIPTKELYKQYLDDIQHLSSNKKVTIKEKQAIQARKLWTDVVAEIDTANGIFTKEHDVRNDVIKRFEALGETNANASTLVDKCIALIRQQGVVTISFQPDFKNNTLTDFQLLNVWEKEESRNRAYLISRQLTEQGFAPNLPEKTRNAFLSNKLARPRYGMLSFFECGEIKANKGYGDSFITVTDAIINNVLFAPGDTLNYKISHDKDYQLCTIHHLELLLWQCNDDMLRNILYRVKSGHFMPDYSQDNNYIEVLLPPINFLDSTLVEQIHIDSKLNKLPEKEMRIVQQLGINITNQLSTPYSELNKQLLTAIKQDDVETTLRLIKKYPSLKKIQFASGYSLLETIVSYGRLSLLKKFDTLIDKNSICSFHIESLVLIAAINNQLPALTFILQNLGPIGTRILTKSINTLQKYGHSHTGITNYLVQYRTKTIYFPKLDYIYTSVFKDYSPKKPYKQMALNAVTDLFNTLSRDPQLVHLNNLIHAMQKNKVALQQARLTMFPTKTTQAMLPALFDSVVSDFINFLEADGEDVALYRNNRLT